MGNDHRSAAETLELGLLQEPSLRGRSLEDEVFNGVVVDGETHPVEHVPNAHLLPVNLEDVRHEDRRGIVDVGHDETGVAGR